MNNSTISILTNNTRKIFEQDPLLKESQKLTECYIKIFIEILGSNGIFTCEKTTDKKNHIFQVGQKVHLLPHKIYFLKNGPIILIPHVEQAIITRRKDKSSPYKEYKIRIGINVHTASRVVIKRRLNENEMIISEKISKDSYSSLVSIVGVHRPKNKIIESFYSMDLFEFIYEKKIVLSEENLLNAAASLIEGLYILHRKYKIDHQDIKPENIFVEESPNQEEYYFCLGDFDLSTCRSKIYPNFKGSIDFAPPEYFKERNADKKDIFSLGLSLLELLTESEITLNLPIDSMQKNQTFGSLFIGVETTEAYETAVKNAEKLLSQNIKGLKKKYAGRVKTLQLISIIEQMIDLDYQKRPSSLRVLNLIKELNKD